MVQEVTPFITAGREVRRTLAALHAAPREMSHDHETEARVRLHVARAAHGDRPQGRGIGPQGQAQLLGQPRIGGQRGAQGWGSRARHSVAGRLIWNLIDLVIITAGLWAIVRVMVAGIDLLNPGTLL
jgi:hypothetical protein